MLEESELEGTDAESEEMGRAQETMKMDSGSKRVIFLIVATMRAQ